MNCFALNENKGYVLYGAGQYAESVYIYLKLCGAWDHVRYVVVSNEEEHEKCFHDREIFCLSQQVEDMKGCQIIVAVSPKHSQIIVDKLSKNEIYDVICVPRVFIENLFEECCKVCSRFPIQNNKVFFDAFNGSGYTCNCKYIAERLKRLDENIDIVWDVLETTEREFPPYIRTVVRDSPEYYYELFSSRVAVFNATFNPHIFHKKEGQYFIDTWHGIGPFKKVGFAIESFAKNGRALPEYRKMQEMLDLMTAASDHCVDVYRHSIGYKGEIKKWGYPRNDVFFSGDGVRDKLCEKYGIDRNKRIVLYAPTFRYNLQHADVTEVMQIYNIAPRELVNALEKRYKKSFVFLYRFHHLIYKSTNVSRGVYGYGIDVTTHPDMQELLVAADVLITDWSSSIWDFSLARKQGKRVFLYQNDIERAMELNGFYMPPDQLPFPKGRTTEELCEAILTYDDEQYMRDVDAFFDKYGCYDDGHASERVAERIIDVMEHPEKYGKVVACNIAYMDNLQFRSRRSVKWDKAEQIAKQYVGNSYCIEETSEIIVVGSDFPDEFCHSEERMKTRGANEKARANIVCVIGEMIRIASNKRTNPDYGNRHGKKAEYGWYRYDTRFAIPEYDNKERPERYNIYRACMIVRHAADGKKYLYDFTRIKKEGVQPVQRKLNGSKHRPSFETL